MRDSVQITYEKNGFRVFVESSLSRDDVQRRLALAAEVGSVLYVPTEIQWEKNAYSFSVRGRQTVKDLLLRRTHNLSDFRAFVRNLSQACCLLEAQHIPFEELLWEYDCIFTGEKFDLLCFVYLPGAKRECAEPFLSDLLSLVSLHLTMEHGREESACLQHFLSWCREWEQTGGKSLPEAEAISQLTLSSESGNGSSVSSWKPFLVVQGIAAVTFAALWKLIPWKGWGIVLWLGWIVAFLVADARFLPSSRDDFRRTLHGLWKQSPLIHSQLLGQGALQGLVTPLVPGKACHIGRDENWSTIAIPSPYISRYHVRIMEESGIYYLTDLQSCNGTYIEGARVTPQSPVALESGISFWLGEEELVGFCFQQSVSWKARVRAFLQKAKK